METAKEFYEFIADINKGIDSLHLYREKWIEYYCKTNNIKYPEFGRRYMKFQQEAT